MSEPMTEKRLAEIEAMGVLNGYGHDLLAEVRRLRKCQQEEWCPGVPVACQKHVDQAAVELQDLLAWKHNATRQLLARSEQAEELLADRDQALAAVRRVAEERDSARAALRELEDERDTHRADRDVALALKSAAERDLAEYQADLARGSRRLQLEHAVVEAAKAWAKGWTEGDDDTRPVMKAVLALQQLEARR